MWKTTLQLMILIGIPLDDSKGGAVGPGGLVFRVLFSHIHRLWTVWNSFLPLFYVPSHQTIFISQVMEIKKIQMKGGTKLGEKNPTWLKQPGDSIPLAFGALLVGYGVFNAVKGHYHLATGKGKLS